MIILGVDPGTKRAGYGIIATGNGAPRLLEAGLLRSSTKPSAEHTLLELKSHLGEILARHKPDLLAVETLYFSKNHKTAFAVAQARGVILLAAAEHGVPIKEFSPTTIKSSVAGYGSADKTAVQKMVRLILNEPALAAIDDTIDALAAALTAERM